MNLFIFMAIISTNLNASFDLNPSGPSKEYIDFTTKYNSKYKGEKFITSAPYSYEFDLCVKQEDFTPCEMAWCIYRSRESLSRRWIRLAEEGTLVKCDFRGIGESLSGKLKIAKMRREKCLRYIKGGNKRVAASKECSEVLD